MASIPKLSQKRSNHRRWLAGGFVTIVAVLAMLMINSSKAPTDADIANLSKNRQTELKAVFSEPENEFGTAPPIAVAPFNSFQAKTHQQEWADYLGVPVEFENRLGMKFRLIPPGEFLFGTTKEEAEEWHPKFKPQFKPFVQHEVPARKVLIEKPFYIGKYELKVAEFEKFIEATQFQTHAERGENVGIGTKEPPDTKITWRYYAEKGNRAEDAVGVLAPPDIEAFVTWLNTRNEGTYQITTEEQWEYACRGGTETALFCQPENLSEYSSFDHESHQTGLKKPNPFGLFDMYGNMYEQVINGETWYERGINHAKPFLARSAVRHPLLDYGADPDELEDPPRTFHLMGTRLVLTADSVKALIHQDINQGQPSKRTQGD